ncbi:methyl-accepting chemotaxis protein [Fundidesulfovibrio soli]|uniref:methyl-accepting chemotaxis protein n=1 Tax=Fundidesulfovibrio soli TaxID=2922716 RepID=UPI001FAFA7DA|nr:methyl-accepting chemotaxis protein [Fundidesulfovibrio soli]
MFSGLSIRARSVLLGGLLPVLSLCALSLAEHVFGMTGTMTFLVVLVLSIAVGTAAGFLAFKNVSGILGELSASIQKVVGGNFRGELPKCPVKEVEPLEDALKALITQLKLTLGNWNGFTEAVLIPYAFVDTRGHLTICNQMALQMLERDGKPADYAGMYFSEFFYSDRNRKAAIVEVMEKDKGEVRDVAFKNFKGNDRHVKIALSPLHDLDGNLSGGLCMYLDYTDLHFKEEQVARQGESILNAMRVVEDISVELSGTSQELFSKVGGASRGAEIQSRRAEETATAMEEMNATVLEVAKNASQAADTASQAKRNAEDGAAIVQQLVMFINQVLGNAKQSLDDMGILGKQADGIGSILNVISDIADQTNLLALNAAIEAARAGDAGRGFAVVADEVRKLAEKTMTATKEVGEAIRGIQQGTKQNYTHVEQAVGAITEATQLAGRSGESLRSIVHFVESTSDQVRAIATASEQQSAASEEINRSIEDVSRISVETSEAMRQSARAVDELTRQAQVLNTLIDKMKNENGMSSSPAGLPSGVR